MSYTMSFEASLKVRRGGVGGLLRHNGRDVDCEQDREVRHSNADIDPARTLRNVTMVSDGHGGWRECSALSEITDALDNRLANVKKTLRKDAVVLRPLVLQLDPAWYAEHSGDADRDAAASDMMDWAVATFGADNIIYASLHNDEASPHLHLGFAPVTEDGRLSQKDWFSGPAALREMHQGLRQHMRDCGYDVDMQNRKPGKHAKRMSVQEYKDYAELQAQQTALEARVRAQEDYERDYKARAAEALGRLDKATTEQIAYTSKVAAWARAHGYAADAAKIVDGSVRLDERACTARDTADIDAAAGQLARGSEKKGLSL